MNKTSVLSCDQLLNIFSASHIATAIYTTENIIVEAVTQAMLDFWGKDRSIIGLPLDVAVPELVGQPFIGLLRDVLATGKTKSGTAAPAQTLYKGELQVRFYDYEYRAIADAGGETYCILHTATDVTERVLGLEALALEKKRKEDLEREQRLNEELAAANEELSSINEELQQTQDSLHELNVELESRVVERTQELAESEANMRYMIDDAPVAIATLKGRELVIESANIAMLKIWGKPAAIIGLPLNAGIPELKGQNFLQVLDDVFATGVPFEGKEVRGMMEYDGKLEEVYTNFVYKPVTDEAGNIQSIVVVANLVTEQVNARKNIEAARHRLQSMISNTPVAMAILRGKELIIEQANQSMFTIWSRTAEEVAEKRLIDVFPELEGQPFPEMLAGVFETGEKIALPEIPVRIVLPDNSERNIYVNFSYDPILDQHQQVESILVTVIDMTESVNNRLELKQNESKLQETTEELAASNEELTAINEEMKASNEELAASNEELVEIQQELSESVSKLKESEERFRFLLNAIPQQVWTAGTDGALNYVNDVICQDFGYDNEEIVGHGWQKFIHPDDLPGALSKWSYSLKSGVEYMVEFRLLFSDGNYRWHLARALPLIEKGHVALWVGTNTDIDLQKNTEQKKDEFLSIASHELKTPLTSIKAFNQLMMKASGDERLNGYMDKSAQHIRRLEKLIADLLDVTKLNSGKLDYNMEPFSFKQLLIDSVENIRHTSPKHEIILQNTVDLTFTGDHLRLEQVMNNFLNNAVKYSPKGEKVIVNSTLDDTHVTVSVQDFGIGIAPDHIEKLFDRYYRVDNTAMRFDGLGLGLFISAEILNRHQGKCWIESEIGKGSTFYFQMPIVREDKAKPQQTQVGLRQDVTRLN